MGSTSETTKPHAVIMPYPAQGHINPMFNLAKLLHHKGFHITVVNSEYNHKRLVKARGSDAVKGLPDFQFETIPDGLPPSDADATQDIPLLSQSVHTTCLVPFRDLVNKLNNTSNVPPVSCIITDGVMSFPLDVGEEHGIPVVFFWTMSACGLMPYLHFPKLIEKGVTPFKDPSYFSNGYLDTPIDWIPGMSNIRYKDLPSFIRTTDPKDIMLNYYVDCVTSSSRASAIVLNTFDALDEEILSAMKPLQPPIYTIGSLHMLVKPLLQNGLNSIEINLWKEDIQSLQWLDSKEPNSVIYVNFGSIAVLTPEQLTEFAWGLANSRKSFMWIIRPDLVSGDSAVLPPEFKAHTEGRSFLTSWCPQEKVLNHPSIGGYLTHSGWNSTVESICSGVPMICWPFFAEQPTNCRYSCAHWGIGMEIDSNVKRDEVEILVRAIIEGKEGKDMRTKAKEWKMKAEEAVSPGGSSYENLHKFINEILLAK